MQQSRISCRRPRHAGAADPHIVPGCGRGQSVAVSGSTDGPSADSTICRVWLQLGWCRDPFSVASPRLQSNHIKRTQSRGTRSHPTISRWLARFNLASRPQITKLVVLGTRRRVRAMRTPKDRLRRERQFNGLDAHLERGSTAVGRPPFDPLPLPLATGVQPVELCR